MRLVVSPSVVYTGEDSKQLLHIINLYLEIFGECEIFTMDLQAFSKVPIRRLNWTVLPTGQWPWQKAEEYVRKVIESAPEGNRAVIEDRFKKVTGYTPEFLAIGRGGFSHYVVFGFPNKEKYILESNETNNATYVFNGNWENLSQMTKAQILNEDLHYARLIHRKSWYNQLDELLTAKK